MQRTISLDSRGTHTPERKLRKQTSSPVEDRPITPGVPSPPGNASPFAAKRRTAAVLKKKATYDHINSSRAEEQTVLKVNFLDKTEKDIVLNPRPANYMELQRQIAHAFRSKNYMFSVMTLNKEFITADNYKPINILILKEFNSLRLHEPVPLMPKKWEFQQYHGAPADWVDPSVLRIQELAQKKEQEQLQKEAAENEMRDFLENKQKLNALINDLA